MLCVLVIQMFCVYYTAQRASLVLAAVSWCEIFLVWIDVEFWVYLVFAFL